MRKIFLIACTLVGFIISQAQDYKHLDYLADGIGIRYKVHENIQMNLYKCYSGINTFINQESNIEMIASSVPKDEQSASMLKPGYEGSATIGCGYGWVDHRTGWVDDRLLVNIDLVNGYRIIPYFFVGAGIGVHYYGWESGDILMPFYVNVKGNLFKNNISPFIGCDIGVSIEPGYSKTRFYYKTSIGLFVGFKTSFLVSIGYELQNRIGYSSGNYNAFSIDLGIAF